MDLNRVKMGLGLALMVCGVWRAMAGPGMSPLGFVPGTAGLAVAVVTAMVGLFLYKSSCPT
jgi:hypothetical protein